MGKKWRDNLGGDQIDWIIFVDFIRLFDDETFVLEKIQMQEF